MKNSKPNGEPKGAKKEQPAGSQRAAKGSQLGPERSQVGGKRVPNEAKGRQQAERPKRIPKASFGKGHKYEAKTLAFHVHFGKNSWNIHKFKFEAEIEVEKYCFFSPQNLSKNNINFHK